MKVHGIAQENSLYATASRYVNAMKSGLLKHSTTTTTTNRWEQEPQEQRKSHACLLRQDLSSIMMFILKRIRDNFIKHHPTLLANVIHFSLWNSELSLFQERQVHLFFGHSPFFSRTVHIMEYFFRFLSSYRNQITSDRRDQSTEIKSYSQSWK